ETEADRLVRIAAVDVVHKDDADLLRHCGNSSLAGKRALLWGDNSATTGAPITGDPERSNGQTVRKTSAIRGLAMRSPARRAASAGQSPGRVELITSLAL